MTVDQVRKMLREGEGLTVEFKECSEKLSATVYETVCAFSNRYGGHLLLGVSDTGNVIGVNPAKILSIKRDFANALNNPQKLSPTLYVTLDEIKISGKVLLYAYIPASSQVEMCSGKIYDRSMDGDMDITRSVDLVVNLHRRKSSLYSEREVFPYATKKDLRLDLLARVRQMAVNQMPLHPWKNMSDSELLKSAGLYEDDKRTGKRGFNLAAILLLGRDEVIQSCCPGYVTDCLLRRANVDRYDDRLMVTTNLVESFDLVMGFVAKHTPDPFFLEGAQRISVRDKIAREVVSNLLVHREYASAFPAKIILEKDRVYSENWSRSNSYGTITPDNFIPQPKNPILARFFVNIGYADTLGSGVRNLFRYTRVLSPGAVPQLIEGDVFKIIVPFVSGDLRSSEPVNEPVNEPLNEPINETAARVLSFIKADAAITKQRLVDETGKSRATITRALNALVDANVIKRVGSDKTGYWRISEPVNEPLSEPVNEPVNEPLNEPVNETIDWVLSLVKADTTITKSRLANETGKGRATITRALKALTDANMIRRVGSDKSGYWQIVKNDDGNANPEGCR